MKKAEAHTLLPNSPLSTGEVCLLEVLFSQKDVSAAMCVQGQAAAPLSPASLANIPTDSLSSGVMPQNTSFHSGVTHHHLTFQLLATYQITFFVMHSGCWVHEFLLNIDSSGPILNISVLCQRVKMSYLKLRKIHTPNMGTYVAVHCL